MDCLKLWPESFKLNDLVKEHKFDYQYKLENALEQFIKDEVYVVIFNSGRCAISCFIKVNNLNRSNIVRLPRYASTCLHVSVGMFSATTQQNIKNDLQIVYQRWGNKISYQQNKFTLLDCVDSLFTKDTKVADREIKLYSFSKLYGSPYGAFIITKNKKLANKLKEERESRKIYSIFQYGLRNSVLQSTPENPSASTLFESSCGPLGNIYIEKIIQNLENHEVFLQSRKDRIDTLISRNYIFNQNFNDIPTAVIIKDKYINQTLSKILPSLHVENNLNYNSKLMKKVYLLPIHHGIKNKAFEFILKELKGIS